ncbi:MAG: FAD-dependent oxidoreductase [Oscillospiraceae bacterium]|nr:FAD-dependent oxidoreductase [Oscillospiraceae bacterium]
MNKYYPHLFSPLKFGNLVSRNRIFAAPYGGVATPEGSITPEGTNRFEEVARGGVGLVCIGETLVHNETGNNHGRVLRLDHGGVIPSFLRCTDGIHRQGALASIELIHPGNHASPEYTPDGKVYGPSGGIIHDPDGDFEITEMDEAMIAVIVNAFGDAAERAMFSGFDMVTVQAAHGWLLSQFLSPLSNRRTDRFGGPIENRARFHVMVAENIRQKCGDALAIDFRLSGSDFIEGASTLEDVVEVCKMLDGKVDMLHISAANFDDKRAGIRMFPTMFYERGCNAFLAEEIKKHVCVPVVTVGGFNDPEQMEKYIAEGRVDAIALNRALLADRFMPEKARLGLADDIMYCTRCNDCISSTYGKRPTAIAYCSVNPFYGMNDREYNKIVRKGSQKVLVVGAGPAGMEAALGAAECGHDVVLAEKTGSFGGMLKNAWHPEFKKDIKRFVEVLTRRIEKAANIKVELNTTVTPEYIEAMAPDSVIIAIGAAPAVPDIPGIDRPNVILSSEIHTKGLGHKVVFIGGGLIGGEEGIDAAKYHGKDVTIIELTGEIAASATHLHRLTILSESEKLPNLRVLTLTQCLSIDEGGVTVRDKDGKESYIEADTIVLSAGMKPLSEEAWKLYGIGGQTIITGDCAKPARMNEAVRYGWFAGFNLQKLEQ